MLSRLSRPTSSRFTVTLEGWPRLRSADAAKAAAYLRLRHADLISTSTRRVATIEASGHHAGVYVGLGERCGVYLSCVYGPTQRALYAIGPGGLKGRRRMIEFDLAGNPLEAPIQCLIPLESAVSITEHFLAAGGLPLNVEWMSDTGLLEAFLHR